MTTSREYKDEEIHIVLSDEFLGINNIQNGGIVMLTPEKIEKLRMVLDESKALPMEKK